MILCIGETLEEREANGTERVLERQLSVALESFCGAEGATPTRMSDRLVIAYEPVWAIGTGRVASPKQAQETHAFIRSWIRRNIGEQEAQGTRIIYGGSVNAGNCRELATMEDVDGFLVGGASLKPEFRDIVLC